jgi:hypothetical protein
MTVLSSDGEKVGKVLACADGIFTIEKGILFKRDFTARYEDVREVRGGEIVLSLTREELTRGDRGVLGSESVTASREASSAPVAEEEPEIEKRPVVKGVRPRQERTVEQRAAQPDERELEVRQNLGEDPGTITPMRDDEDEGY